MKREIVSSEINDLVDMIKEQQEMVLSHQQSIPQIELDILMSNVRKLYERLTDLDRLNRKRDAEPTPAIQENTQKQTDELIANINVIETVQASVEIIEPTPTIVQEEQPLFTAEVIAEEEVVVTNAPTHMQQESLLAFVETPVVDEQQEQVHEEVVIPATSLSKERTKEFTKPVTKPTIMASLFDDAPTVATSFAGTKTYHDKISAERDEKSLAEKLQKNPVSDLKKSIGINEKFAFINELFDGDLNCYNEAIDLLNKSQGHSDAVVYLEQTLVTKYNWNGESDSYLRLKDLIDRRFMV